MFASIKRLFAAAPAQERAAAAIEYRGFEVIATPRKVSSGWSTEGLIRKQQAGKLREIRFIRADTCMSEEEAVVTAQGKARKIIDERGDSMFESERA
ncbi:MAG: hypothetical protein ACI9DC_002284 [Gammaproteobacteria bacterium]|jgi:hypothetical protein